MINLNYDNKFDVLYLSFGMPKNSYGEDSIPYVVTLRDMDTDEITGYTIMEYKKLLNSGKLFNLELPISVDFINDVCPFIQ